MAGFIFAVAIALFLLGIGIAVISSKRKSPIDRSREARLRSTKSLNDARLGLADARAQATRRAPVRNTAPRVSNEARKSIDPPKRVPDYSSKSYPSVDPAILLANNYALDDDDYGRSSDSDSSSSYDSGSTSYGSYGSSSDYGSSSYGSSSYGSSSSSDYGSSSSSSSSYDSGSSSSSFSSGDSGGGSF